jgi:hypothetical protein
MATGVTEQLWDVNDLVACGNPTSGGRNERHKMGRIQAKRIGPVAYYLYKDAKSSQAGKPTLHTKFGPYASMKEAEAKREEEEAGGRSGYEYHYRIAVEPILIPK